MSGQQPFDRVGGHPAIQPVVPDQIAVPNVPRLRQFAQLGFGVRAEFLFA